MIGETKQDSSWLARILPASGKTSEPALIDALIRHYPNVMYPKDIAEHLKTTENEILEKYHKLDNLKLCTKDYSVNGFYLTRHNFSNIGTTYLPNTKILGMRVHLPTVKSAIDGWDSIVYFYLRGDMNKLAMLGANPYFLEFVKRFNYHEGGWGKTPLGKPNIINHFVYAVMLRTITQTAHAFQQNEPIPELPHGPLGDYWQKRAFKQYEREGLPNTAKVALELKDEKTIEWMNYLAQANEYYLTCL